VTANHRPGRHGFSMMEMLIVLTVIALVIGMALPALQSSREASRRIKCVNSLRQIVLALHNYETSHEAMPPGVIDPIGPVSGRGDDFDHSWIVQLLPFMEQGPLALAVDPNASVYAQENLRAAYTSMSTFLCPSDPHAARVAGRAKSSYAGCHHDVEAPIDDDNHGVFFLNSHVRNEDVVDGRSQTIFVGEKRIGAADLGWMSGTRATLRNTGSRINAPPPSAPPGDLYVGGFSSGHPGGANFAFGDGSIRFLTDRIDAHVYRLFGHRDDGEMVEDGPFPRTDQGNR